LTDLVKNLGDPAVSVVQACVAVGLSRATFYRSNAPPTPVSKRPRAPSPRRLAAAERAALITVLHSEEFVDQPPFEVFATLLSRGVYLASIRTMYRLLAELGETQERRNQRKPHVYAKPSLTVTAPNQVWTWDITKLATNAVGVFLHAYVIIDLFSRYVVGWMVAAKECKHLATQLFADTIARHEVKPGLKVHSDRGSAMKSDTLAQLLATLGVDRSFSRPHVSDDNAHSEAQFKTMKYQPDYPGRFGGQLDARAWLESFFGWHNDEHHHSGLALFTPAEVFFGRVDTVRAVRQGALDKAYNDHPERFPGGAPRVRLPPSTVSINPITSNSVTVENVAVAGSLFRVSDPNATPIASSAEVHGSCPRIEVPASGDAPSRRTKPIAELISPPWIPSDLARAELAPSSTTSPQQDLASGDARGRRTKPIAELKSPPRIPSDLARAELAPPSTTSPQQDLASGDARGRRTKPIAELNSPPWIPSDPARAELAPASTTPTKTSRRETREVGAPSPSPS